MPNLPPLVLAFAERNVPRDRRDHRRLTIAQRGEMCLKPGGAWRSFTAEQWFATREVAFCWHARVKMAPLVTAVVEDAFEAGHGRLDVKMWGKLPIAHEEGPAIDRGEVQRYLAELVWNPAAFLANDALRYDERDEATVRVWTGEPDTHVDMTFDAEGDVVAIRTDTRAYQGGPPRPWHGRFSDYASLGGLRLPTRGEVRWELPEGPYTYWRGEILEVHGS